MNKSNGFRFQTLSLLCLLSFGLLALVSCGHYKSEKRLEPENKEFLEKVRYLITGQEYKIFMSLLPTEKKAFIEDFWKRRDPDPDTEENEFKEAYFNRIRKANELFGVGQAGFYTDRGMIYVLFGPPDDIHRPQMFTKREGSDQEVWLYSRIIDKYPNVRINFVDHFGTGSYELVKDNTIHSILQEVKLYYINLAQQQTTFPYNLNIVRIKEEDNKADLLIQIKVPYKNIWFTSKEDKMETTLAVKIDILDDSKKSVWEFEKNYFLSFLEKEVTELFDQEHLIEITLSLKKGNYSLKSNLTTQTGEKGEKVIKFHI